MIRPARTLGAPLPILAIVCAFLTLVSPWIIGIPQARADVNFGFENPVCWLILIAMAAALLATDLRAGVAAVVAGEALLLGWFGWVMWLAGSPQYTALDFPFIGIDLIGPGWFEAALGLLAVGAAAARRYHQQELPPGAELWLLAALPGFGLVRLGRTERGVIWATLVAAAVFLASVDSPVAPLFQLIVGHFDLPPAPPTRVLEWIFLGAGVVIAAASVVDTALVKRRMAPL